MKNIQFAIATALGLALAGCSSGGGSSNSSSGATTTGSASSSSTTGNSGSTGVSGSSSTGSSGTTGTLTYASFCTQASAQFCGVLAQCQLIGAAVDCTGAITAIDDYYNGRPGLFACDDDGAQKLAAGTLAFNPSAAQGCLDAIAATACHGSDLAALLLACGEYQVLPPVGGNGTLCTTNSDCVSPTAGTLSYGESDARCLGGGASFTCAGTCQQPAQLGEDCSSVNCGPGQGSCAYFTYDDAGSATLCAPFAADGGPCNGTGGVTGCDSRVEYCGDAGAGITTCQPMVADGGGCSILDCQADIRTCSCDVATSYCAPVDASHSFVGFCQPLTTGAICAYGGDVGSCGPSNISYCSNIIVEDGGLVGECAGLVADGGSCSFGGPFGCPLGEVCSATSQSPGICVPPAMAGEACDTTAQVCLQFISREYNGYAGFICSSNDGGTAGTCQPRYPVGTPTCNGDLDCDIGLYCGQLGDGGSGCQTRNVLGDACDASARSCSNSYCQPLADGGGTCTALVAAGAPCDESLSSQYQCADLGYCGGINDGGSICYAELCD